MFELFLFLFTDFDNRMGNFHTHCVAYVEKNRLDNPDDIGQIFIPTNQIIGLTWCRPIDTSK